jgi:hypothetical protein
VDFFYGNTLEIGVYNHLIHENNRRNKTMSMKVASVIETKRVLAENVMASHETQ